MKLLLDNNLSPRLVQQLTDIFPGSSHVALLGLDRASDPVVWHVAKEQGYTLVSKDADFNELLTVKGFPPKVIWIRLGNCTTAEVANAIRTHNAAILTFGQDNSIGLLEIQ
jgi:predicted nuclease of predicted toxin-antitoxin system